MINKNVQTTLNSCWRFCNLEFKVDFRNFSFLVDHSIFRAFNKGALGMLKVEGAENAYIQKFTQRWNKKITKTGNGKELVQTMPKTGNGKHQQIRW